MVKKVAALATAFNLHKQDLVDLCKKYDREVDFVDFNTQEDVMEYVRNNECDIIVNTWPVARSFGSYTNEMIGEIGERGTRAIIHSGAGYDVVGDPYAWKSAGVQVANCPTAPASATADTAMFLLLGAIRNFYPYIADLKTGEWRGPEKSQSMLSGRSPQSLTLGIMGMGNIGALIRDRSKAFGFREIQYYKRSQLPADEENGAKYVGDLDEFLRTSDAVVIVVPHNKSTHHLLNRERLENVVKPGCSIVNVARGPIIDEEALADVLESGRVSTVGLDVFEFEPNVVSKLRENPRALITPHVGSHVTDAWEKFELELIENVSSMLETGKVVTLIPELK